MMSCGNCRSRRPSGIRRACRDARRSCSSRLGSWGAVENFRFFDVRIQAFADPEAAVAEVKGEGRIKATGRSYRQDYVVFLRASGRKIGFLREYFDPTRAAKAMNASILDLES
jgi:ketosteroid isomerase-like protein